MRFDLKNLMEKLGVNRVLAPYETQPWFHHDGINTACSAEVRMGPGSDDIEAEIQFLKDETEDTGETGTTTGGGPEQIMRMKILPAGDNKWAPTELKVKGKDYVNQIHDWETKGCNFFRACIQAIQMGDMPNIEELIKQELGDDDDWGGGKRGKIGRKSPTIKPAQLLGIKRGM